MVTKRSEKAGLPPGTLVPVRSRGESATVLKAFTYDEGSYKEITVPQVADVPPCADGTITWIDIDGLADLRTMNDLGERFGLHALMIEDILNTDQRPKIEEYQDHLFVVVKMLTLDEETGGLNTEQVSLVLGHNYVISLQERPGDILDPVRDRIRNGTGRVRKKGADYLLYALLDVIVDHYFKVVDALGERIAALERKVLVKPGNEDLVTIQELRSNLIHVNRYVMPTRELAGRLYILQNPLIEKSTRRYINDLQDHTVYIAETISTFREMLSSLENTYHAGQNARMTQVMKLLTIISTIFIPLTFVVGIYGMNFDHMPELRWRYGYFAVMGLMGVLVLFMLLWFRRKRWL